MMKKSQICNVAAYLILSVVIVAVSPFLLPKLFGYEPYGILSDSMEPNYPVGSIVYVRACEAETVGTGDVITFQTSVKNHSIATHRVVKNDLDQQEFITKGDHNEEEDATPVAHQNLLGIVTLCVPMLGNFYLKLVSMSGISLCTFAIVMVVFLWYLASKWRKEKQ